MRAIAIASGLLALAGLSGCDLINLPGQHSAAVTPPCNCIAQAPPEHLARLAPPPTEIHRHHYRRYAHGYSSHSYSQSWASEYEEQSSTYEQQSYSSQSRVYDEGERESHRGEGWTDGYGRIHYGSAARVAADDRRRLDPWHDYDKHCPERE